MNSQKYKLGDLAEVRPGFLTREAVRDNPEGVYRLLQIRDFNRARTEMNAADMVRISPDTRSSLCMLQTGDVLFLAKGANNFAAVVSSLPGPTLAASYFFILRPRSLIMPEYLAWFLNHEKTRAILTRLATTGAHMPIIRRAVLESIEIPLPDIAVQKAIADLDCLRREEQELLSELARKQQDLISAVCMTAARNAITNTILEGANA